MKKIITLLLVLALMVPMCLVANADAAKKPFQGVTWSKPPPKSNTRNFAFSLL